MGKCGFASLVLTVLFAAKSFAHEKKDVPLIMAITPLEVSPGTEVMLKLRGLKLDVATEVRFPTVPSLKAELKEKKKAELPNGLEAKDAGDTQLEAKVSLPADLAPGVLAVEVVAPGGVSEKRELRVIEAAVLVEEKEPNNGFKEAQSVEPGKLLRGKVQGDKDVDVFVFTARAKQKFAIEVFASRHPSLLDPMLTVYDEKRRVLRVTDDTAGRDPVIAFEAPADGPYFLVLQDAHDRGGSWHSYELSVEVAK